MRVLSAPELLNVWERGLATRPFERALAILSAAAPESPASELGRVSIAARDAILLRLREAAFGSELPIVVACPRCQNQLETVLPAPDLCARFPISEDEIYFAIEEYRFHCRAPNSEDLTSCLGLDVETSRRILLARCTIELTHQGKAVGVDDLPNEVITTAMERIAEEQADVRVELTCPECKYRWNELFDIVSFFWAEIDAWARRVLREVHILASAYGWKEGEILALTPSRRQIYLAMAEA